jgi:Na+/H+-dicarboxylate symporter
MKNITPLGWFVLGVLATLALWLLVLVSSCLWWVGFSSAEAEFLGWCWGSMTECVGL